jgi:DNA-binding CsgD family transcriptional regulator
VTVLLEREAELEALRGPLMNIRDGRGRLLVLEAPAGRGKSALLAALSATARDAGVRVLHARGGELERTFAFGAIGQLFERAVADADTQERARLLSGAAAPAEALLARDGAPGTVSGSGALHAIYWLATNLSLNAPLLITVDDLHWVDEPSLEVLIYLARRLADVGIVLAVTLRPSEPGASQALLDALREVPDAVTVGVRALSPAAVATLVQAAVPEADDALCAACHEMTAGNPFYVRELLASLDGDASAVRAREIALPELGDRIARRVARVGPDAVALADAMAVLGDGARLDDAAALAEADPAAAARAAAALRRVELLSAEDPFAFAHPLVRRALYDALTTTARDRLHAGAAHVLAARGAPPGAIAEHLTRLRPAGSAEVVAGLRAAADEALVRGAPEAAATALRRALDEDAPEPQRAALLHELGQIEFAARDLAAVEHLTEAYTLTEDPVARARIAVSVGGMLAPLGQWDRLLAVLGESLAALGDRDPLLALDLEALRAGTLTHDSELIGEYDRDEVRLEALARGTARPARALATIVALNWANRGLRVGEVRPLIEHAFGDGALLRARGAATWPITQGAAALIIVDEDERALELLTEFEALSRQDGSLAGTAMSAAFRILVNVRRGDLPAVEADLQTIIAMALPADLQMEIASIYWFLNDALGEREAIDAFAGPAVTFEPRDEFARTAAGGMMVETRGLHRLRAGDRDGALADLHAAAAVLGRSGFSPCRGMWRSALALAMGPDADEQRRALAQEEVAAARACGLPRPLGIALRTAAVVGASDDEVETLRTSVDLLAGTRARLEHARSLLALGGALRRSGHRIEAREPLAEALELAHRCGAEGTAARAIEELHAAGARPRRPERTGPDALTASEARVARLVAEGRSNAEAAQELFVSLKTVETHLTRIYAKLGLSGPGPRRRLAGALDAGQRAAA